jgi:predicted acetyltransferase
VNLRLSVPDMHYFPSYFAALEEGFAYGSGDPYSVDKITAIKQDPEAHIAEMRVIFKGGEFEAVNGNRYPRVPQEVIWVLQDDDFIGAINFRPTLNEMLVSYGGHAGYSITPSARGKGYMSQAFGLLLADKDRMTKIDRDHMIVTTDPDNVPSQKVITHHGGVLVDEFYFEPMQETTRIYHIPLKR